MTDKTAKTRREEYTEATRQALLVAGREIFTTLGYHASGIEAISRAARVTRGAFYHHFEDKKALFDALTVAMQSEAAEKVAKSARKHEKVWDRLYEGINTYLDVCLEPTYRRIVIQDAPAILGSIRFHEIEVEYPMALLKATLNALHRQGELEFEDIDLLTRMVDAMICKVAIMLPDSKCPDVLRDQSQKLIDTLLCALRRKSPIQAK